MQFVIMTLAGDGGVGGGGLSNDVSEFREVIKFYELPFISEFISWSKYSSPVQMNS